MGFVLRQRRIEGRVSFTCPICEQQLTPKELHLPPGPGEASVLNVASGTPDLAAAVIADNSVEDYPPDLVLQVETTRPRCRIRIQQQYPLQRVV